MKEPYAVLPSREGRAPRVLDGIVAGGPRARGFGRGRLRATWVLVAREDEPVEEFFLNSPFGEEDSGNGEDPVAWICRGVRADGTLRLGAIDFEVDHFVSDVLHQAGDAEKR